MKPEIKHDQDKPTAGREATTGIILGRYSLSVGLPEKKAPDGWRWALLSTLAKLESGHTPSRSVAEYWGGDIPWIGIRDATENHGRTISKTHQTVTQAGIDNSSARVLPTGTVCLSRTASVGYVVVMGRPMATSQDFVNWICSPSLDNMFLKYVFIAEHESMLRFASGTTHQTIYYPEAKAFHVCLPGISEQKAIAHFLGALDAKIELNRQMNQTLAAIMRALFQSWFVDFDPVCAKTEGRETGLPDHLTGLFPDAFEESELGRIPRGWKIQSVGSLATVVGGSTPSTKEPAFWVDGQHCWTTPKDLADLLTPVLLDTDRKVTDIGLAQIASGLLPVGTILISSRAPIGYLAISEVPTAINQGFIGLKPAAEIPNLFLLYWAEWAHDQIVSQANGSTFLEISKSNFRPIPVVVSPAPVLKSFDRLASPMYQRIVANERESHKLLCLRDTLLPKLVSGVLRIRDAERILGGQI